MRFLPPYLVLIALAGCGGGRPDAPGGIVWRLDPRSGLALGHVRVEGRPCGLAAARAAAWVTDIDPGALYRVAGRASRAASLPGRRPCGVAVGAGATWVGTARGEMIRVPPGRAVRTGARAGLGGLAAYRGSVWAADLGGDVLRVGRTVERVRGVGGTEQLAPLRGALWAIAAGPGRLVRIDARSLAVRRFEIGPSPKAIATGDGAVWVALTDRRLLRFDPGRERAVQVARLPDAPILLAAGGGVVWSLAANGRLASFAEAGRRVTVAQAFRRMPFGLGLAGGALWVGIRG